MGTLTVEFVDQATGVHRVLRQQEGSERVLVHYRMPIQDDLLGRFSLKTIQWNYRTVQMNWRSLNDFQRGIPRKQRNRGIYFLILGRILTSI